jgi:hypothetical protein
MYAMQYAIPLPADYDMQIIRDRVVRGGPLFDGFAGLGFKAFLIRERAAGATHNEYAPFYVWNDLEGMRAFCWGEPGFSAIVRDFGRPPIQDWTIVGVTAGPVALGDARSFTLRSVPLPDGATPSHVLPGLTADYLGSVTATTVRRVAAVDVTTWTVILAELSAEPASYDGDGVRYEVLHVSPGPDAVDH